MCGRSRRARVCHPTYFSHFGGLGLVRLCRVGLGLRVRLALLLTHLLVEVSVLLFYYLNVGLRLWLVSVGLGMFANRFFCSLSFTAFTTPRPGATAAPALSPGISWYLPVSPGFSRYLPVSPGIPPYPAISRRGYREKNRPHPGSRSRSSAQPQPRPGHLPGPTLAALLCVGL